jgi:peptide/nickel transport system permease protein
VEEKKDIQDIEVKEKQNNQSIEYERVSYWEVVWGQLKKNKVAIFGIWCIVLFVLIAIYAPFISMSQPFYFSFQEQIAPDGGTPFFKEKTVYPFLPALFDRNYFESGVDIFFNLLMVISPLFLIVYLMLSFVKKKNFKNIQFNLIGIFAVIQLVLFLILMFNPSFLPYMNYKEKIKEIKASGGKASYLFPLLDYSYREGNMTEPNPQPPDLSKRHLLGTDKQGRDVFVRMVYGTRISMTIGVVAVSIYVTIGIILGSMAGYFGGKVDLWISRFVEVMICFPSFFLILTIVAFIEKRSIFHIMFIIGLTHWTGVSRLVRAEFLKLKNMDYVQAAIALGFSRARIMFGHILPNAMAPVLVSATFGIASAILTESSLSFLGLGDPSAPSWGEILNIGRVEGKLWLILSPGIAIFFVVFIFNLVGEALRDALDPRLRQ